MGPTSVEYEKKKGASGNMGIDEEGDVEEICSNLLLPRVIQQVEKLEVRQP